MTIRNDLLKLRSVSLEADDFTYVKISIAIHFRQDIFKGRSSPERENIYCNGFERCLASRNFWFHMKFMLKKLKKFELQSASVSSGMKL